MTESIYERIAGHQVSLSLALVLGIIGLVTLVALTIVFQWSKFMGFDLTQSFTEFWLWVLFAGSGVCLTLINYGLYRPKKTPKAEHEAQPSKTSDTMLNEEAMSQVMGLASGGLREALKVNLRIIGTDLENRLRTRLPVWFNVEPSLKERLITDKALYDALEDLSKSLEQRGESFDTPDFERWDNLCKAQYELLKRTDLFPFS